MIHLKGTNLYLYEKPITRTTERFRPCAHCPRLAYKLKGAIDMTGWLAQKSGGKVRRFYCPACAKQLWPIKYRKALYRAGAL